MRGKEDLSHIRGAQERILPPSLRSNADAVRGRIAQLAKAVKGPLLTPHGIWLLLVRGQSLTGKVTSFQERLEVSTRDCEVRRFDSDYCRQFLALKGPTDSMKLILREFFGIPKAEVMSFNKHRAYCFAAGYIARFQHLEEATAQVAFYQDWLEHKARS